MQMPSGSFIFGRVILSDIQEREGFLSLPGSNLVYIYSHQSETGKVTWDELDRDDLLIPPTYTNRLGWSHGIFETIDSRPLTRNDLLAKHCFLVKPDRYIDEKGNWLSRRYEPCGFFGQASYLYLDDLISDALAIPRADR